MKIRSLKRTISFLFALALMLALLPTLTAIPAAATGYDRGYAGGMGGDGYIRAYGVDVSEHQGIGFNFQNLKNNGYSFVILRCGFVSRKDYRFEEYYAAAKAAGLDVGAYFYSYATTASDASYEADRCLSYIAGKTFEYPVYFDFEDPSACSYNGNTAYGICTTFLDKIAAAGYLAGLYGYASWMDPNYGAWVPTSSICSRYECWMANYYDNTPTNVKSAGYPWTYGMYQYTSSNYIGGVGPLDTNVCYKDYPTIVKTYGFNGYSPVSAGIPDGTYTIGMHEDSAYKVDIYSQSTDNGVKAHAWSQNYVNSQKFVFQKDGADTYTICNVNSGKYLEVAYGGANGEYKVTQCHYTGADAQRWYLAKQGDGSYSLINKATGKYMDLSGGSVANGTDIQTWASNGSAAQKFWLTPVDTLMDGVYTVRCAADASWGWDISGYSMDSGANLQVWNSQHKFVIQHGEDGYYTIRALGSGKNLDVSDGKADDGTNIIQYDANSKDNQKWLIIPNTDGTYSFVSKCNGKYIDQNGGGNPYNGQNIACWTGNGTSAQKWTLQLQSELGNGTCWIGNQANPTYRLEIASRSTDNGANLLLYRAHGAASQQFTFTRQSDGLYTITNVNSDKQLDVAGGGKGGGTNIQQWSGTSANQKWSVIPNTDGSYSFVSAANNLYMDLSNNTLSNNSNIQCWRGNGSSAQRWVLHQTGTALKDGIYHINSGVDAGLRADVAGRSLDSGATIHGWAAHDAESQKYQVTAIGDGFYSIMSVNSGKYFDVKGGGSENGTDLQQYDWNDSDAQKWLILKNLDGTYSLFARCSGMAIDLSNAGTSNGTNIQLWTYHAAANAQKWTFTSTTHTHNYITSVVKHTNTTQGYTLHACACGSSWKDNYVDADPIAPAVTNVKITEVSPNGYRVTCDVSDNMGVAAVKFPTWTEADGQDDLIWHVGTVSKGTATFYVKVSDHKNETGNYITHIYAYDEAGNSTCVPTSATVPADTQAPTISDVEITEVTADGYRVTCKISDNVGVTAVKFPTWTEADGQDDLIWHVGTVSNGTATFYVKVSDHKTRFGQYITHIYAYDAQDNYSCTAVSVTVPARDATAAMTGTLPSGIYSIGSSANKNFVLDVDSQSMDNGANIHMWVAHGGESQMWVITSLNNGYYNIRNLRSGKYLDAIGSGTSQGTNVDQWAGGTYDNQLWQVVVNSNGTYTFINKCNGLALDMSDGGDPKNGTNVQMWGRNATTAQQWYLTPQKVLTDGTYKLGNSADSNMQIEVGGEDKSVNGANISIWSSHDGDCQKIRITANSDGTYTLTFVNSGKVMDADGYGTANGTNVIQQESHGGDNQKWLAIRNTDGTYTFINRCNGLALDMTGGGTPCNGQNIQCWQANDSTAQKWVLQAA